MTTRFLAPAFLVTALFSTTACAQTEADSAPADTVNAADVRAFTDACLETSNMGEQICRCAAKKAKEDLSETGFDFVLATLQQDEAVTERLRGEMSTQEAMQAGMFLTRAPAACRAENAPGTEPGSGDGPGGAGR